MKLNVHERMILIPLLPEQESYAGMGEITSLKLILQLTGDEATELVTLHENGQQELDNVAAAAHVVEIPVSGWMTKVIRDILSKMNDHKKIRENQLSLYEKFCLDYDKR